MPKRKSTVNTNDSENNSNNNSKNNSSNNDSKDKRTTRTTKTRRSTTGRKSTPGRKTTASGRKTKAARASKKSGAKQQISKHNTNRVLQNFAQSYEYADESSAKSTGQYSTIEEYQASFDTIVEFSKTFTGPHKKKINLVIFHNDNSDGYMSVFCAWKFLYKDPSTKPSDLNLLPMKPASGNRIDRRISNKESEMKDKVILIVDLDLGQTNLDYIRSIAKEIIIIDDHSVKNVRNTSDSYTENHFTGVMHSACSYVWKFFYPKLDVPMPIMYVDDSDRKLHLSFVPNSSLFSLAFGIRYTHNKMISMAKKTQLDGGIMDEINDMVENNNHTFWIILGKYFDEYQEGIKSQIAINAKKIRFRGYDVGILNFNSPALSKPVGRQIVTNFQSRGEHIDFAVTWGFEHMSNAYRLQFIKNHFDNSQPYMDVLVRQIYNELKVKDRRGAGGSRHIGNLYVSKTKGQDIWDLFRN